MTDQNEFRIKATIDPSGATAGAEEVEGAVGKIEGATEGAGEGVDKLTEHLTGMRTGRMAARELFEAFEGGGKSIEGATMLLRMFALTAMDMAGPAGIIASVGLAFVAMWASHQKASKDASESVKSDWDGVNEAFKKSLKEISENDTFRSLLDDSKKFSDELHIQETTLHTIQAALDRLQDAKFGAQEETLNLQEQQALQGKDGAAAEEVRLDFQQRRDALRAQHDKEKAERELDEKEAALIDLSNQRTAKQAEMAAASADIQRVAQRTSPGATGASLGQSDYEYARDTVAALRDQQRIQPLTAEQWTTLGQLSRALPGLSAEEDAKGPQYQQQIDRLQKQREALQAQEGKDLADAQKGGFETFPGQTQADAIAQASAAITEKYSQQFDAIEGQIRAFTQTQEGYAATAKALETSQKTVAGAQKSIEEIDGKIKAAQTDIDAARINVGTAATKGQAEAVKDANAISNADLADKVKGNEQNARAVAEYQRQQKEKEHEAERAQKKTAEDQIADYRERINEAGHALPEAARKVLDDAMRKIEAMDRDNPVKEALDLLNLYIDRQGEINRGVQNSLDDIRAKHHKIL